jgi:hypothetical protein
MTYEKIMLFVKYLLCYIFNKFIFNVTVIPFFEEFKRKSDFISFQSSYKWYSFYSTCLHGAMCSVKLIGRPNYAKMWCVTDYTKHVRNVRIKTPLKMQNSKTGSLYWNCDRVRLWTCRRKRLLSPLYADGINLPDSPRNYKIDTER